MWTVNPSTGSGQAAYRSKINVQCLTLTIVLAILYLEAIRWLAGTPFTFSGLLGRFGFIAAALAFARLLGLGQRWAIWGWLALAAAWVLHGTTGETAASWAALAGLFSGLIWLDARLATGHGWMIRLIIHGALAAWAGGVGALAGQLETRFSDEEFFVALQATALAGLWLVLRGAAAGGWQARFSGINSGNASPEPMTLGAPGDQSPGYEAALDKSSLRGVTSMLSRIYSAQIISPVIYRRAAFRFTLSPGDESPGYEAALDKSSLRRETVLQGRIHPAQLVNPVIYRRAEDHAPLGIGWVTVAYLAITICIIILAIRSYQTSFYPPTAPAFPGISVEHPFLCGKSQPSGQTYAANETYARLLAAVEANPHKASPEYAVLALGRSDDGQAALFRETLLAEAGQGLFTGPAGSVKSSQYEAALRVYFYARVRETFPDLFSAAEQDMLRQWFAAINRRALSVEWVDWMYALAFTQWPHGPYENQENGAGLLALLETESLADSSLSAQNRAYLLANYRGWAKRFRVSDDAAVYQPEWLHNALFQAVYNGGIFNHEFLRLSFEWLLLQAPPSGAPLHYNHLGEVNFAGVAALGAALTGDGRYTWLAGRALDDLEQNGKWLSAAPGMENPFQPAAVSPQSGSCLLYGDSGLPNQIGPLAPDKIVFRSGWEPGSLYLLLNLRFSGWHRYKATNALVMLNAGAPLIAEQTSGETAWWLPKGKSLFRDKRIPRENLNGLAIANSGMSAALYALTGIGSAWAQDPPYYAAVTRFETGSEADVAEIILENWRGWTQTRTIYFYPSGLMVIVDEAGGPVGEAASVIWHTVGGTPAGEGRYRLGVGAPPAEMILLPLTPGEIASALEEGGLRVAFNGQGELRLATVFLTGEWAGAEARVSEGGLVIEAEGGNEVRIELGEE